MISHNIILNIAVIINSIVTLILAAQAIWLTNKYESLKDQISLKAKITELIMQIDFLMDKIGKIKY